MENTKAVWKPMIFIAVDNFQINYHFVGTSPWVQLTINIQIEGPEQTV